MGSITTRGSVWRWLVVAVGAVLGILAGYQLGYAGTLPGFGALGVVLWLGVIAAALAVAVIIGLIAFAIERTRPVGTAVLGAAAAGLAAVVVMSAAVPRLGLGYHEPVVLQSSGTATLSLEGVSGYVPQADSPVQCSSAPDTGTVQQIYASGLGRVPHGMLRARIEPGVLPTGTGRVELWIDAADLSGDIARPEWGGDAVFETGAGGTTGTARFQDARLTSGEAAARAADPPPPARLSGAITWRCADWRDPTTTVAPDRPGSVTLELTGEDLVRVGDPGVSCSFEEDGSVLGVLATGGYELQGWPVRADISLNGPSVPGGSVLLTILVESGKGPPPGAEFVPNWVGMASLRELGEGEQAGQVVFTDMPSGVDPSVGDPPAGWPATISGTLAWECT